VDLNGDGHVDILSGSYSRQDRNMAGLFQVLLGNADGTFQKPTVVLGTDGKPLILPGEGEDTMTDRICTRHVRVVPRRGQGHVRTAGDVARSRQRPDAGRHAQRPVPDRLGR
jgi:hypothetical protein